MHWHSQRAYMPSHGTFNNAILLIGETGQKRVSGPGALPKRERGTPYAGVYQCFLPDAVLREVEGIKVQRGEIARDLGTWRRMAVRGSTLRACSATE